jgi:hypothetical protein
MKRNLHASLRPFAVTVALLSSLAIGAVTASAQTSISTMTFQRTIDTPGPGVNGSVVLKKQGAKQSFTVNVRNLPGDSFGVFYGAANATNSPVFLISVMSRSGSNDNWVLHYDAVGSAPPQLPVTNLDDMADLYLFIAQPSDTNSIVDAVLVAQVPALTQNPAAFSFHLKSALTPPLIAPPNPKTKGLITTTFLGKQGRSIFDLHVNHLSGGGAYTIFVEDPPSSSIFTNLGSLELSASTVTGTFHRDTGKGETLPFQSPTEYGLSGRGVQIRDAFDQIHVQGVIP